MKFIDFPEGFEFYNYGGVFAFPQGFWAVAIFDHHSNPPSIKSLIVHSSGEVLIVDLLFKTINSFNDRQSDYFISCSGNHEHLANIGLKLMNLNLSATRRIFVADCNGRPIKNFRLVGQEVIKSKKSGCFSAVLTNSRIKNLCANANLNKILCGCLPSNPGIGFRRGERSTVFINPDESREWIYSCLSIDELTCLAVHKNGCCIIDNPT